MLKLKSLNNEAWAIIDDNKAAGVLNLMHNKVYNGVYKGNKFTFMNKNDVESFFQSKIFDNPDKKFKLSSNRQMIVKGLPTGLADIFPIDTEHELPVFTKTEKSDILYSAGYYCINYPMGWLKAFCPKLATVEKYGFIGPFKTKDEQKLAMKRIKKEQKHAK